LSGPSRIVSCLLTASLAASGCAAGSAAQGELSELKSELRAMREENARVARRLERLESRQEVTAAVRGAASPHAAPAERPVSEIPALAVVKLKPRHAPAPPLKTEVPVAEPAPETLENLEPPSPPAKELPNEDPALGEAAFENALSSLNTGDLAGGVNQLLAFADEQPRHPKADNALYFASVGLLGMGATDDAIRMLTRMLSDYPAGDAVVDAMLKLGECHLKLRQQNEARAVYDKLISSYPGTAAAIAARQRLASLGSSTTTTSANP
jgi:TolA-binding protein